MERETVTAFLDACHEAARILKLLPELPHGGGLVGPVVADEEEVPLPDRVGDLQDLHVQPQQHLHVGYHGDAEAVATSPAMT